MKNAELSLDEFFTVNNNSEIPLSLYENDLILSFPDSETSTILGMQTIWFVIALVFLILSVAGLVTAAVLCFCRQRAATPRHPHNAHNAQTHPPVSFPCEFRKTRAPHSLAASLPPSFHPFLSRFLWPQPINHEIFRSVSRSPQRNGDFVAISN